MTIVDALTAATDALNNAVKNVLAIYAQLQAAASTAQTAATTVVNNFLARPPVQTVWCDPVNGSDANDGSTAALAKKSLEDLIGSIGTTVTQILLLNDALISKRPSIYASLQIYGVQAAPGGSYIGQQRTISFLGTSTQSPIAGLGSFCAGFFMASPNLFTNMITFSLQDQPAGQNYTSAFESDNGTTVRFSGCTLLVSSPAAGSLVGSNANAMDIFGGLALGAGAAGHIFTGVPAGANPNNLYQYHSNITSG